MSRYLEVEPHIVIYFFRIMARPITPGGKKFGIGITGLNFDPIELADEAKAKEFIREQTALNSGSFRGCLILSLFIELVVICPTHLIGLRPNMRMVNKFDEGRVFIVGGKPTVHGLYIIFQPYVCIRRCARTLSNRYTSFDFQNFQQSLISFQEDRE